VAETAEKEYGNKIPVDLGKLFPKYSLVYVFQCRKIGEYK